LIKAQMKISLGKFACSSVREQIGPDLQAAVQTALFHYVIKLKLGRPPVTVPRGLSPEQAEDPEIVFELGVDAETEELLSREAERQGTTLDVLATHSVFVYLAELDLLMEASPAWERG
jgi:hypothetical protein